MELQIFRHIQCRRFFLSTNVSENVGQLNRSHHVSTFLIKRMLQCICDNNDMVLHHDNNVRRPVVSSHLHGNCLQMKILAPNDGSHENTSTHGVHHETADRGVAGESGLGFRRFLRCVLFPRIHSQMNASAIIDT